MGGEGKNVNLLPIFLCKEKGKYGKPFSLPPKVCVCIYVWDIFWED